MRNTLLMATTTQPSRLENHGTPRGSQLLERVHPAWLPSPTPAGLFSHGIPGGLEPFEGVHSEPVLTQLPS